MGVSVRMTRNTRVYLPFWIAIPLYLCVLAGWLIYAVVVGIPWLIVQGVRAARGRRA